MPKPRTMKKTSNHPVYEFSLIFSGPSELTEEMENSIYEAGCSDTLLGIQNGEIFLDFHREAPSFQVALISAIMDVERAGIGLELIRVETAPVEVSPLARSLPYTD
ncbi:hypothetical protein BH23PLA1_BH23PLA1_42340 [soil metagenome]